MSDELRLKLTKKQGEIFQYLAMPLPKSTVYDKNIHVKIDDEIWEKYLEALGGGGKGGGKTNVLCKFVYYWTQWLINYWRLPVTQNHPITGFIGRKRSSDLLVTTLQTWAKEIPSSLYRINQQKKIIIIDDRAALLYGGFDDRDTVNKFNSSEFAFAALDQMEEISRAEVGSVRGAMRLKIGGKQPPFRLFGSCNPPIGDDVDFEYLREEFISAPDRIRKFFPFLWKDNPYIAEGYEKTLQAAYGFNPDLYAAMAEGKWDRIGAANLVIARKYVESLVNYEVVLADQKHTRITSADISEEGGVDETVIYDWVNARIVDQEIYAHRDLMDTCGRLVAHAKKNGSNMIAIDRIGSGSGVYSRLCEIYANDPSVKIYGFDSRITTFPSGVPLDLYANYRAYAYFNASQNFIKESKCTIPDDRILINQLCSVKFKFNSSGKYLIESKQDMAKSPDRADAFIIGLDAIQYATPVAMQNPEYANYSVNARFAA